MTAEHFPRSRHTTQPIILAASAGYRTGLPRRSGAARDLHAAFGPVRSWERFQRVRRFVCAASVCFWPRGCAVKAIHGPRRVPRGGSPHGHVHDVVERRPHSPGALAKDAAQLPRIRSHSLAALQRCSYVYGPSATALEVIDRWNPALDWQHPWKLGNNPHVRAESSLATVGVSLHASVYLPLQLRRFMRELKVNYSARPEEYDDYNLRTSLGINSFSCG